MFPAKFIQLRYISNQTSSKKAIFKENNYLYIHNIICIEWNCLNSKRLKAFNPQHTKHSNIVHKQHMQHFLQHISDTKEQCKNTLILQEHNRKSGNVNYLEFVFMFDLSNYT